jgi:hypothetical protein
MACLPWLLVVCHECLLHTAEARQDTLNKYTVLQVWGSFWAAARSCACSACWAAWGPLAALCYG